MKIEESDLKGVFRITPNPIEDHRGTFARTFCDREFQASGLASQFVQASTAKTNHKGTVRGLHYQREPHWETKLLRCTHGTVWVVAVDLRPNSATHKHWRGFELSAESRQSLYVSPGFAQGYQALCDESELFYQMDKHYHPESAAGFAYNDPAFDIEWPLKACNLSVKDQSWSPYTR